VPTAWPSQLPASTAVLNLSLTFHGAWERLVKPGSTASASRPTTLLSVAPVSRWLIEPPTTCADRSLLVRPVGPNLYLRCLVLVHHGAWPSAMTMAGMAKMNAHVAGSIEPRTRPTIDNPNSAPAIQRQTTSSPPWMMGTMRAHRGVVLVTDAARGRGGGSMVLTTPSDDRFTWLYRLRSVATGLTANDTHRRVSAPVDPRACLGRAVAAFRRAQ
jgi:hypothetical protein